MALTRSDYDLPPQDGAVVFALPGYAFAPVANKPRRGRLPKVVPSLSAARTERQERIERWKAIEAELSELERFIRATEFCVESARRLMGEIRAKAA